MARSAFARRTHPTRVGILRSRTAETFQFLFSISRRIGSRPYRLATLVRFMDAICGRAAASVGATSMGPKSSSLIPARLAFAVSSGMLDRAALAATTPARAQSCLASVEFIRILVGGYG